MENMNAVVTGSTSGIGKEIAFHLLRKGASVILAGTNPKKISSVISDLKKDYPESRFSVIGSDLLNYDGIEELSEEVKRRFSRLDILVNNAGAFFPKRETTEEGLEKTFALNHMSYFRLTGLLLPLLKKAKEARIINTSSNAHRSAHLDMKDLQTEHSYNGWKAYSRSKLANLLFTKSLSEKLKSSKISVNAFHPGVTATDIPNRLPFPVPQLFRLFARTAEEGAQGGIYLAGSASKDITGRYFRDRREIKASPQACDRDNAERLWNISEGMQDLKWQF